MADLSNEELRAQGLLKQLQALSPADASTAVRITLRLSNGRFIGDALLSADAVQILTDGTTSMNEAIASTAESSQPGFVIEEDFSPEEVDELVGPIEAYLKAQGGQA